MNEITDYSDWLQVNPLSDKHPSLTCQKKLCYFSLGSVPATTKILIIITNNTDHKYTTQVHDTYFQTHEIVIKKTNSLSLYYHFMINGKGFDYF